MAARDGLQLNAISDGLREAKHNVLVTNWGGRNLNLIEIEFIIVNAIGIEIDGRKLLLYLLWLYLRYSFFFFFIRVSLCTEQIFRSVACSHTLKKRKSDKIYLGDRSCSWTRGRNTARTIDILRQPSTVTLIIGDYDSSAIFSVCIDPLSSTVRSRIPNHLQRFSSSCRYLCEYNAKIKKKPPQ